MADLQQAEPRAVDFAIPDHEDPTRSILLLTEPHGMTAEAIRAIRTRLIAQHVRMGRRALAICSVAPSAQASFVAANLAVALAQVEIRTLLVETDLRHPRLAGMFGLPENDPGLSDALIDEDVDASDIVRQMPLPTLSIVTAGRDPAAGVEAMGSARFASIANRFLREHDLTIFTTTPSNRSADAQRVASVAGYALIVARKDRSYIRDIEVLSNALKADGATIAGSVLISS
ncbi:Uncharacterized protein spsE [Sphingomonas antarctica]|uniref:CpsD/CapB family tyrosine-protein kinase n=1 Tax=Sphingomonas antarctica TaxID=2040274 RepID=UPI0039EC7D91